MTGVCLTIDGRDVVVDVDSRGMARALAATVDGRPVRLTAEQLDAADKIVARRTCTEVPEVW